MKTNENTQPTSGLLGARTHHGRVRTLVMSSLTLLLGAVLLLWGWNTVAVGLLGAPEARFIHAIAFEGAIAGVMLSMLAVLKTGRPAS